MNSYTAHPRQGDKANSPFFEEWLPRLLEERDRLGLTENIRRIDALMMTLEPGHSAAYIRELCLMTPYNYLVTLDTDQHLTHILRIDMNYPDVLVREVKDPDLRGIFRSLNEVYPIGAKKPNSRYMGEIFQVENLHEVVEIQKSREIRFFNQEQIRQMEFPGNMAIVKPSPYTHNIIGYWERPDNDIRVYALGNSRIDPEMQAAFEQAQELRERVKISELLLPIDHLATRIYSQNREVAILEYLGLSSYYYWGSYDIPDQNSSTNVTKSLHYDDVLHTPAKVFTAANHPYFCNHLLQTPSPTESFVRNFGPRLHHIAVAVRDGKTQGKTNIDYVVSSLAECGQEFLLQVIGSEQEGLKQIFSRASTHTSLIIEYVQRFHGFEGFFTKENVADLTAAAGTEESLRSLESEARK
ncbi:hypothetical protein HFU84_12130 [Acidithiobacillus sp. CV18-2]|uniref:Uncharacterized protein n=1 Tax=Igneacidithiobacillus copahuensis TaxID=2724909 RepID=A0AAE2YND2_9PROT|nr:hypothetical protein [Acidithiobacillus sp. CV18-3]MBU2756024.1 hypothetical protein [Acidithiobacillus sp. BN09-2]MBU2778235.1 hypothetical protein [Acidithiobacillus sp. CV18-2]MBU2787031.1 hypothetical protein [Igneacidithiobacillus copahuensis]MBU2796862.1 hypothetical protein [Acidithiobacillus sp. VAN18-2]MBU2799108.1 hypothetical protein [Acidithiobacillus sp. VAN18-4]